ncbi:hypothetical protein [Pedobacter frigidisoli]|uniref:hypothetical protein n=1 Tax=Pedobacter frigidisoli TaxID=2530455 RepID=UPI00292F32D2|nr:hypothetical protein [Pedobacter frigidisoli]
MEQRANHERESKMYQHQSLQQNVATASKVRTVRSVFKPKSRSFDSKKRKVSKCTTIHSENGFLNHSFAPLVNGYAKEINSSIRVTERIFSAARNLCDLYDVALLDYKHLAYPQNVAKLVEDLQQEISVIDNDAEVLVISNEVELPTLAITKVFNTKTTLYYLPIEPLYLLKQQEERKQTAELLLSVLCYFYQVVGIPYFGENSSYMYYVYQMIYDWYTDEEFCEDAAEQQHVMNHIALIESESDNLLQVLSDQEQLNLLGVRFTEFHPKTTAEVTLKAIAFRVNKLIEDFPCRSIMDSIEEDLNGNDRECKITAEHYLSFIWSAEDCLYDQLMEMVNSDLQEYNEIDEPMSMQLFDLPQCKISHDLSFEQEFFDLLNELSDNLYDFAHERHH